MQVNSKSIVDTVMSFRWNSTIGVHEENHFCRVNVWRDCGLLPSKVKDKFLNSAEGDEFTVNLKAGEVFRYNDTNIIKVRRYQFRPPISMETDIKPKIGRFYPLGYFTDIAGVYPQNIKPARIIHIDETYITIDRNVPIARYDLDLTIKIERIVGKADKLQGECRCWCEIALDDGPGMQIPYNNIRTEFQLDEPQSFSRESETDDQEFYSEPRLTTHIDSRCHENLQSLYEKIIPENSRILDLMSSYQSHMPEDKNYHMVGLGLNSEEMKANPQLKEFVVCDINKEPKLQFADNSFDCVVCDLSIEYLVKPLSVISEIKRVLKKGGLLSFSFSNRYFPPKVIKLWKELHDFEKMGYVLDLLLQDGGFKDFQTFSFRGWYRPFNDKYFESAFFSDPLYVVTAKKS